MLYTLLTPFAEEFGLFNLFNYITFRTGGAIMTALLIAFVFGPRFIRGLKRRQGAGQPIRELDIEGHVKKQGTPTMGGLLILFAFGISALLWARWDNLYTWVVVLTTFAFGAIGFFDDYLKLAKKHHDGLSGRIRLLLQVLISVAAYYAIQHKMGSELSTQLALPFVKDFMLPLGPFYILLAVFVIVGAGNAVNLTDGLDGLAIVPVMIALSCFGFITYLASNAIFSDYLEINHIKDSAELAVLCGAMIGAGIGFLWFNAPPAMVFMGDTGSLSMGAALGTMSIISKHEIVLAIIGGLFVLETASVIIQVASYKLTGKRVFRMAPLHHHFEKKGWAESTIVIRFWIIAIILALIGLSTLKIR